MIFLSQLITKEAWKLLINNMHSQMSACLRSKRSLVRIQPGVPVFNELQTLPGTTPAFRTLARGFFCTNKLPVEAGGVI